MELSINEYKDRIINLVNKALNISCLNDGEASSILEQINKDVLTIGIIGQMNVGKTSLVNSLIFGDNTLPTSETPMTAALTYITYAEKRTAVAEMLTFDDYSEIMEKYNTPITNENKTEIESAKNLINKIKDIPNVSEMFGKIVNVDFKDFGDYVGADGKYTSLVKLMRLTWDNERLKGICIVDTPGYNDPVTSRELTTKRFLSQANVIIWVQDVAQNFTKPDIELINTQIPKSGIGKLVSAINKKDSVTTQDLEQVLQRASEDKKRISENNPDLSEILNTCKIIPISSIMGLIGQMDDFSINSNTDLSFWKSQLEFDYPEINKKDYLENSGIENLQVVISNIVINQKQNILLKAPCEKLEGIIKSYINKLSLEKESLEETNEYLSDEKLDFQSVLDDLKTFEENAARYSNDLIYNCEESSLSSIDNTRYSLRDKRDEEVENINFVEKHSKPYLRGCFNDTEDSYFKLNRIFGNYLRELGNKMADSMHNEVAELERKLNLITLNNSQLIHTTVIRRISQTINNEIPRTIGNGIEMNVTFPGYSGRQDIYQVGIRSYFRKMLQNSFSNDYINDCLSDYQDVPNTFACTVDKEIDNIIQSTRSQYSSNKGDNISDRIENNQNRILEINNSVSQANELITEIKEFNIWN